MQPVGIQMERVVLVEVAPARSAELITTVN